MYPVSVNTWVFLILTCVIGGGAAFMAGRGLALKWRPLWQLVFYTLILGAGIRFLHFALFEEPLVHPLGDAAWRYLVDTAALMTAAFTGFRITRVNQMVTQYHWLYEKAGPFAWRKKA
jgi:hypothetical protein